jgi:hypothetical protein
MTRTLLLLLLLSVVVTLPAAAQQPVKDIRVVPVLEGFTPPTTPEWGSDVVISSREPIAGPSGAGRANGTGFVAVPDTGILPNRALVVYRTTNFGVTWAALASISPAIVVQRTKLVRLANDSVYCFFLTGGALLYFNVEAPVIRALDSTNLRDFDVASASSGGLHLFTMKNGTTQIRRWASSNNGGTWGQTAVVTSAGAFPRVYMNNQTADTLTLTYYGPVKPDTARSVIRMARYRETAPGMAASAGFFDVDTDTTVARGEHGAIKIGNVVWFFNTRGTTGAIDIQCRVSTDAGTTFGAPFPAAGNPNVDEYWFSVSNYTVFGGGIDFVYYADSLGSTISNTTDRLFYAFLSKANPGTVSGREQFTEHPPVWSPRLYVPGTFEYYDANGEVGAVWVGLDGSQRRVYYDRYNASPTSVGGGSGTPESYALGQNYPNPFNPSTVIEYAVPSAGDVNLAVFDLLGREVRTLVSGPVTAGVHRVRFDARDLASGVYLYRLRAGEFVQTRKLTLVR